MGKRRKEVRVSIYGRNGSNADTDVDVPDLNSSTAWGWEG